MTIIIAILLMLVCIILTLYVGSRLSHDGTAFILVTSSSFVIVSALLLW